MKFASALIVFALAFTPSLAAQQPEDAGPGPDRGASTHVPGVQVLPLAGKPFAARSTTEWTRTLEDGTVITSRLYAMVIRDGQGRIYRENHLFVPKDSSEQPPLINFKIYDPLTRTATTCVVATHRCDVTDYHAPVTFKPRPAGPFDQGRRSRALEPLGLDTIDGLSVTGTRETITVNTGVIGNSQPIHSTQEYWYSPDLQVNLAVTRQDPKEGLQVIRLGELSVGEPDPSWLQVPAGYVVRGGDSQASSPEGSGASSLPPPRPLR